MSQCPDISLVIASVGGPELLERCLGTLPPLSDDVEVLVAGVLGHADLKALRRRFPQVIFLPVVEQGPLNLRQRECLVFRLRSLAVQCCRGRIVVMTEDHVRLSRRWLSGHLQGQGHASGLVGGPVDLSPSSSLKSRALYFCEYVQLMSPMNRGRTSYLSGVNVSYLRSELQACRDVWSSAFFENEVQDALGQEGCVPFLEPDAALESGLAFSAGKSLGHLHVGGWRFGCYRRRSSSSRALWLWRLTCPLIPVAQLWRMVRIVASRQPALLISFLLALPWTLALVAAWSLGEIRGLWGSAELSSFEPPVVCAQEG